MSSGTSTNLGGTSPNSTVASSFLNYSPYSNTANTASLPSLPSSSVAGSGGITSGLTGSLIGSSGMPALPTPGNYTRQTVTPVPAAAETKIPENASYGYAPGYTGERKKRTINYGGSR